MSEKPMNKTRRSSLKLMLGGLAAIPVVAQVRVAHADEPVSETDPMAVALKYVADATKADRADKAGVAGADQFCHNCMQVKADSGEWRGCNLFPGKLVNENGWCSAWVKKA
ncbi:high-potential iron-sulfur protein [Granulosicoccaceae sp. 1_MG-2023]|nr:high-potential iron-sulfur protein [Granulosicoccaceae sp. 1_MG-2023]